MVAVEMQKVETVIRRLMKEYGIEAAQSDVLQTAIENVISEERDSELVAFANAFNKNGLDKAKVWRYYAEA